MKKYLGLAIIALLLSITFSVSASAKARQELEPTVFAKLQAAKEALKQEVGLKLVFPTTVGK